MKALGPSFEARWAGICVSCGTEWEPGETIGFIEDDLLCRHCYDMAVLDNEWERHEDE